MRIVLMTVPGRGDTEPFVALARRLMQAGHSVRLAARPDLAQLVSDNGIEFSPLGNPYQPFIAAAAKAGAMGAGHPLAKLRFGLAQRRYVTEKLHDDAWSAAQGAEAIIYKYPWITPHTIAEKLGVPCVPVMLLPLMRTSAYPSFLSGRGLERGPFLNRLVWNVPWQGIWQGLRIDDKRLRANLGMQALPVLAPTLLRQGQDTPVLCAWSPAVLPGPSDWPENTHVTGYWFLDPPTTWDPPAPLVRFLAEGPPPVSIGFGSMLGPDPAATRRVVLEALELSGQRGVLLSGWGGLGEGNSLPSHVYAADSLPHGWLFPHTAAVVHHGGAGTTGAALRAGVPAVVTPLVADQPSWARIVQALGAGPAPIPFTDLTAGNLAAAIREAATNPAMRHRAYEIGKTIRSEDGIGRTIEIFFRYVDVFNRDH